MRRAHHPAAAGGELNAIAPVCWVEMRDTIIAIAIVVLLVVGFWWTRGAGGIPGAPDDPAAAERWSAIDELGDPMPPPAEERQDREHEIE
jgi:hypothetical protein